MLSTQATAVRKRELSHKWKIPAAGRPGFPFSTQARSVGADVDRAIARAERGRHQLVHIAAAVDHAEAEAEANVMMMEAPATAGPAERLGGSSGRRQRGGAQRSCGNESKSKLAKHGHSPNDAAQERFAWARVALLPTVRSDASSRRPVRIERRRIF